MHVNIQIITCIIKHRYQRAETQTTGMGHNQVCMFISTRYNQIIVFHCDHCYCYFVLPSLLFIFSILRIIIRHNVINL